MDSNWNGNLYTLEGNGGDHQKWRVEGLGNETFRLHNIATGKVLDSNGAGDAYTLENNGGNYQKYRFFRP